VSGTGGRRNTGGTLPACDDGAVTTSADGARVVQITDTHLSVRSGVPPEWEALVQWLRRDPPDLIVNTGDIVYEDPDDEADRAFARRLHENLPAPLVVIPGNHDVGFYGEEAERPQRLSAFRDTWGGDRFVSDLAGWRLVGADAYLLGSAEHDEWLADAVSVDGPVLVFVHQPVDDPSDDEWVMPPGPAAAFARATAGANVRLVASGHRHRSRLLDGALWAPSLTLVGDIERDDGADPRPGFVEFTLSPGDGLRHEVVRPWIAA
jgi:3',5'-cyclic AMP phosphodiesterase CpdA